jgi:hypothetical protein
MKIFQFPMALGADYGGYFNVTAMDAAGVGTNGAGAVYFGFYTFYASRSSVGGVADGPHLHLIGPQDAVNFPPDVVTMTTDGTNVYINMKAGPFASLFNIGGYLQNTST